MINPVNLPPRYLTLTHKPQENLLERRHLVDLLFALFQSGNRWIVVHGESGIGKTTLANAFFHAAQQRDAYQQFGWIDYSINISKSLVRAFISNREVPEGTEKSEAFYDAVAREEALKLRNWNCTSLLVFDGVASEQAVLERLDLLEIKNANVLITTRKPFADKRFWNVPIPPLEDADVLHFFSLADFDQKVLTPAELVTIRENLWLLRLLTVNTPKVSEKVAKDFLGKVFAWANTSQSGQTLHQRIAEGVFESATPSVAECWVMLQLGALPNEKYKTEALAQYLSFLGAEDVEVTGLEGYVRLDKVWELGLESPDTTLSALLVRLTQKGWLTEQEGHYSLHRMAVELLKTQGLNDIAFFPELCECLSVSYFQAQTDFLKDNLHYENHLLSLLDFVGESSTEAYLDILQKLITYYKDTVVWKKELACRLTHLRFSEAVASKDKKLILLHDMAANYIRLGQYGEAIQYGEKALRLARSFLPESDPNIALCQNELGWIYKELGQYERARELLEAAFESYLKNFGLEHPDVAVSQSNLGTVYSELGQYERARELLEVALESNLKNFGPDHLSTAFRQSNLANVCEKLGQYERTYDLCETALESFLKNLGPDHPDIATMQSNLASACRKLGQYERAHELLKTALESVLQNFGPGHPSMARIQSRLAYVYRKLGQYERAQELLKIALESDLKNFGPEHPTVAKYQSNLGNIYRKLGQYERARELLETALASDLKNFGPDHPDVAFVQRDLAKLYHAQKNYPAAIEQFEKALHIIEKALGREHPEFKSTSKNLKEAREAVGEP